MYIPNTNISIYNNLFGKSDILSKSEIETIKNNSNIVFYNKKNIVFKQDTPTSHIMYVKSGLIKIIKESIHKNLLYNIITPGNFLGITSTFGDTYFQHTATTLEDSEIMFIDINTFTEIMENNGQYSLCIMKYVCADSIDNINNLITKSQKHLPGRLADIILYFSEKIYNSQDFDFPLTRNELAEFANTSKESIIRTLTEFKNDKIIELNNRKISINSLAIIKTLSRLG